MRLDIIEGSLKRGVHVVRSLPSHETDLEPQMLWPLVTTPDIHAPMLG